MLTLGCWFLLLLYNVSAAIPYYAVVGPSLLRPNSFYDVAVTVTGVSQPTTVQVNIEGRRDSGGIFRVSEFVTVNPYETRMAKLKITDVGPGAYNLTVTGNGAFSFYNSSQLQFLSKSHSVFVQTDKAIYKPGHKVMFRIVALSSQLKPAQVTDMRVFITDGKGNRVKEWDKVEPNRGVFSEEFELSSSPVLGDWKINVKTDGEDFSKVFSVAEYVLPKFQVTLEVPKMATFKDSKFPVTVRAKYTYGRPVKGEATISVYPYIFSDVIQPVFKPPVRKIVPVDGKAVVEFDIARELELTDDYQRQIQFDVVVKEELTGRKQNASAQLTLYKHKYKLELVKTSEYFKPGLKYTAFLKLVHHDGTPVIDKTNPIKVRHGYSYDNEEYIETIYKVSPNGMIQLDFYPPENATTLGIEADYLDVKEWFSTTSPANSPSNSFIQASVVTQNPTVNQEVEISINSTFDLQILTYEILGRGDVIQANSMTIGSKRTATFRFLATYTMAPKAHVIVHTMKDGEVIADALDIELDGALQNYVKVDVSTNETEPGRNVQIALQAKANSAVYLMGIDQSVLLIKEGNDISKNDVMEELRNYEGSPQSPDHFGPREMRSVDGRKRRQAMSRRISKRSMFAWPGSFTAHEAFNNAGAVILTNGYVHEHTPWLYYRGLPVEMSADENFEIQEDSLDGFISPVAASAKGSEVTDTPRVRAHFPETWIWEQQTVGYEGRSTSISKIVPDTITSWVISAFSLDPVYGLGLIDSPAKLNVFRPFFVSLDLPYSIIRGETVAVPVVVFNYMNKEIEADVTLENTGQFEFADLSNDVHDQPKLELFRKKTVTIKPQSGSSTSFMITPKELGYLDIKVTARTTSAGDTVVRKLLVKPEGETQHRNFAFFVDLRNTRNFDKNVTLDIPKNIVPGSEFIEVSAVGDILGPSITNLDHLIRMPFGCGEQNMLNFVPNIVVLDYLKNSLQLTQAIETKSKRYLELGYQRELTYKHDDGSFSAFGKSDESGSTWLTAFVAKSFKQAMKYITIEEEVITQALEWLASHQAANGSFPEVGTVWHKDMQGGSSKGLALTAYVLTAFLEASSITSAHGNTINKAIDYIDRQIRSRAVDDDPYSVALASYALHLANHPSKDTAFSLLEMKANSSSDMKWWKRPSREGDEKNPNAWLPNSIDVEMTAYAMLSLINKGLIEDAIPVMKWLISQQNEQGGFASTQDTIVAIGALAQLAEVLSSSDPDVSINFAYSKKGVSSDLRVNKGNSMILQKIELPTKVREVNVTATGRGFAIVQVSYRYNVNVTGPYPMFILDPQVDKNSDQNHLQLSICSAFAAGNESSNMVVMEVALPSGFTADMDSLPSLEFSQSVKRVETRDGDTTVVLYFDKMTAKELCPTISAFRTHRVARQKPVPVTLYDYYDQSRKARVFYEPTAASLVDICDEPDCSKMYGRESGSKRQTGGGASAVTPAIGLMTALVFFYCLRQR